jgi:protein SFI1
MSSGRSLPQDAGKIIAGNAEPFYTNEDVAVLHDIVVLAQELLPKLPDRERLPTNALFNAYYDILPRVGVNADYDSRYARILFKIGGLRGQGTLYEKFEEILSRMGIEIEFDHEETGEIYSQLGDSQTSLEAAAPDLISQDENTSSRGRRRRNSESSGWNVRNEVAPQHRERRNSFSSLRKNPSSPDSAGQRFPQDTNLFQPFKPSRTSDGSGGDEDQHIVRAWVASAQEKPHIERGMPVSTHSHSDMQVERGPPALAPGHHGPPASPSISGSDEVQPEINAALAASSHREQGLHSLNTYKGHLLGQGPENLMQTKDSLALQHHLSLLAKRQLQLWRNKAVTFREENAELNSLALQKDTNILLSLAMENWRNSLLEKRHIAETERFFAHLEQRSVQARNLYLLHKAFTHWGISAFEAGERTSIARRHIIKTRTFNAWRDITAINELKVRRQVIKKFFGIWKRRHDSISSTHATSVQIDESNLLKKTYGQWVRNVSEKKATTWWSENAKQLSLFQWTIAAGAIRTNQHVAEEERLLRLARNSWRIWRAKTLSQVRHDWEAKCFHQGRFCSFTLRKWRRETGVIPAKKTLQADVNVRLLRDAFALWLHRSRQERQAAATDRLRIIREAWTNWRHKLRFQVLEACVNERVILRSVYKWVLAERSVLAQRVVTQRLLLDCLNSWTRKSKTLREQKWAQEDLAQSFARNRSRYLTLQCLHSRLRAKQQHEADAANFFVPRILGGLLSQWSERSHHLQQLERWSRDAEYYFLASRTLKRWKISRESAKREKLKAAYAQVRRTKKMNLARSVLFYWRHKAQKILELQARAIHLYQNRTVIIGMNIFDRWRARVDELQELESLWREGVLSRQFSFWRSRTSAFRQLEVEAIITFQERQQSHAVKKWSLLTLQLRSQSRYATEIREKNLKRSFRKIFAYWQQRTGQRIPVKSSRRDVRDPLEATPRAEFWSEFGDDTEVDEWAKGLDEPNASTPIPGYLKTPSKRMERVTAAAARLSSTTPRAPLPSPFERQMRARYLGGLLGVRKSQLSIGADFADIAGTSNNDDHEIT